MKKIKYRGRKRIICILSALCMIGTLIPSAAFAADCQHGGTYGTFNGQGAYVKNGALIICSDNFPDLKLRENLRSRPMGEDGLLTSDEVRNLQYITFPARGITNFTGINYFTNLTAFRCVGNFVSNIDVSKLTKLTSLNVANNNLTSLDVSKNTKLEKLYCHKNYLTNLNLSSNSALTLLQTNNNELRGVTFPETQTEGGIETLKVQNNNLTSLDFASLPNLKKFYGRNNNFGTLDFGANSNLQIASVDRCGLSELNIQGNSALTSLDCDNNNLTAINLGSKPSLLNLYCDNNRLTDLNTASASNLERLYCAGNDIDSLDTSDNKSLKDLDCANNNMSSLSYSPDAMKMIWCYGNDLPRGTQITGERLTGVYCDAYILGMEITQDESGKNKIDTSPIFSELSGEKDYYCNTKSGKMNWQTKIISSAGKPCCVGGSGYIGSRKKATFAFFPQQVQNMTMEAPCYYSNGRSVLPKMMLGKWLVYEEDEKFNYSALRFESADGSDISRPGKVTAKVTGQYNMEGEYNFTYYIRPADTKVVTMAAPKRHYLKVTWHESVGAEGYEVKIGTNIRASKNVKKYTVGANTFSKGFSKLKTGTRYFSMVRPFIKADGKVYYGNWSETKALKAR